MPARLFLLACLLFAHGGASVVPGEEAGPVFKGGRAEALTQQAHTALPTVTVRGFLNFRTTVDGTVIVFTPASDGKKPAAATSAGAPPSIARPSTTKAPPQPQTTNVLGFEIVGGGANEVLPPPTPTSSTSRRRPSSTSSRATSTRPQYPTGLVTVLGGTHVHRGVTTIHETKVIGTYIDGKYAQILQSTSRLVSAAPSAAASGAPTPTFRAPEATPAARLPKLEPSPSPRQQHVIRSSSAQASKEARLRPRKLGGTSSSAAALQSSFRSPEASSSRQLFPRRTQSLPGSKTSRFRAVSREPPQSDLEENSIAVASGRHAQQRHTPLLAAAGTRLRYVPARNTHTVRLNRFKVRLTARPDASSEPAEEESATPSSSASDDVDPLVSVDAARVRYEPTTLTSLVTLHAAQGKSVVRTLTITTSVPRALEPSELVSNGILEGSEGPPAALTVAPGDGADEQTPPLVVSRVYSTTEHSWRTSLVPIFDGLATTTHTLTESFIIRKIVTAYRTMPPGDLLAFDERNVTLDLDSEQYFQTLLNVCSEKGAGAPPPPTPQQQPRTVSQEASYLALPSDGDQPVQLANPFLNAALSNNPLAAVYLGLQQLNQQQATLYSTVTQSSVYTTTDTVFHTKLVSFYDGRRTRTRTLSESLSTTERTLTSYTTSVVPYLNTQALQLQQFQQQQLQQLIGTQLGVVPTQPPAPRYTTVTSTYTTVTTATSYSSKIYTLIYNAFSTRYRTVTSSSSHVTTLTVTSTSSYLVQPTAPPAAFAPQLAQALAPATTVAPALVPSQPVAAA
ncbi:uncharacterized protein LOC142580131 isoform X1 [Dermacentor variabilis]|uniref:uncharacterized protein LOC142580131 isoform X1 n=1 Tax=Dermacentor variabilis TaxID=34621 RepID=UPI003F5C2326